FDRLGHNFRPPLFELLSCHHAVLNGEEGHQQHVDNERFRDRLDGSGVDALGNNEPGDKADRIQKRYEKKEITSNTVQERDKSPQQVCANAWTDCMSLGHYFLHCTSTAERRSKAQDGESAQERL